MSTLILAPKLYIPPPRPKAVHRLRLSERLNEGLLHNRKLTLIAAPAGFGKTTLLSEWVAANNRKAAWLSLDEADSDPTRFLTYLVAALQKVAPTSGEGLLDALESPQPPATETILTTLVNEIAAISENFILVLDDYHLINARAVDDALSFLVEHLPPQMHLVIATREDPPLPLARLRVRNQLTELRATDLRFTAIEAAGFLKGVMDLDLTAEDVAALEARTEGWIAGLQLAALSIQGHQDVAGFIRAFAGDNRYIVDYLVEEVLQRQSEVVRRFLLQTAILDRLNGSLCEAVTGQEQGQARLEALERGNFFIVPLDDKRQWYRYHHLFADVLLAHLMAEQPGNISNLHWQASNWYEHNGSIADAIRHSLAGKDFERAATLVEMAVPVMRKSRQEVALLGWLKQLPEEIIHRRPVLNVHYAGTLLASGELEGVEARLQDAERWLAMSANVNASEGLPSPLAGLVVIDQEEFRYLPGLIAIFRAGNALAIGDVFKTMKYGQLALGLLPEQDQLGHGAAAGLLGLAYWTVGDLEAAHHSYTDSMARLQRAGHISDVMGLAIALAGIRITQGYLHEAMTTYERALQLATEQHPEKTRSVLRGTADMYVGMSELQREHNNLNAANQLLFKSQALGEFAGLPQNPYRWCIAMARLRQVQGNLDGALEMFAEAERLYVGDFFPYVRPIAALKARVWAAQGQLSKALGWAREQGLSADDELSYLREFEHITLARILLNQFSNKSARENRSMVEANGFLDRLLKAAQAGERRGIVIEILVLQALAQQMQGDITDALVPLERALTLAEPEGYVRLFVDEGLAMAQLLRGVAARGLRPAYTAKLLAAFEKPGANEPPLPPPASASSQALTEPLSQRELEVLRLFKTELSGPQIARELVIALSTLRTHTKSIYTKLDVDNRRAAVKRAAELDLR